MCSGFGRSIHKALANQGSPELGGAEEVDEWVDCKVDVQAKTSDVLQHAEPIPTGHPPVRLQQRYLDAVSDTTGQSGDDESRDNQRDNARHTAHGRLPALGQRLKQSPGFKDVEGPYQNDGKHRHHHGNSQIGHLGQLDVLAAIQDD